MRLLVRGIMIPPVLRMMIQRSFTSTQRVFSIRDKHRYSSFSSDVAIKHQAHCSSIMLVELVCLVLLIVLLNKFYHFVIDKPSKDVPPGLPRLPIWGSYWFLLWGDYRFPHKTLRYYTDKYKTKVISCWLGDYFTVIATNYQSVKELLTKKNFDGRMTDAYLFKSRAFGKKLGVFFTDGPSWKEQRRFTLRHMRDFGFGRRMDKVENDFAEEMSILLETLKSGPVNDHERSLMKESGEVLFPDILYPCAANFFLTIFTGERLPRTEHRKLLQVSRSAASFQRHSDTTGGAIFMTPWLRHMAHGFSLPQFVKSGMEITNFIKNCFKTHESSFIEEAERGFLDVYIKRLKEKEEFSTFSEDQLCIIGTDFIFPAITANPWGVTVFVKYMMHHPHVMENVQKEIDTVVGRDRLVTLNDRVNLPYTDATVREVLRADTMTPWSVSHRALDDGELCGFKIPRNTVMISDLYAMHHDPEFWGDPENFRPERFLTEDGHLGKDHSLPFGAGGRLCAGETFARQFLFLISAALVQNFEFSFVEGEPSSLNAKVPGFATSPKDLWIRIIPRTS